MGFTLGPNTRLPDSSVPSLLCNPGRPTRPGPPTATMGGGEGKSKKRRSSTSSERDSKDRHSKEKTSKRKDKDAAFKEISKDDYFAKNNEFATWLKEEKGKYFSDLSSESARDLFLKFVKQWNKGKLPSQYYEGITSGPRSAHNWNIKA
ncbi:hypothetical protein Zm00014a_014250 [Zea mays]|uniref:Uncharacterized protein n=1 Tax=Zea mays TaxID=4577 RepID=A0A3L6EGW5_MAIZE|nr:hypothetical protein Zm00014a_014250 [Zea mays]